MKSYMTDSVTILRATSYNYSSDHVRTTQLECPEILILQIEQIETRVVVKIWVNRNPHPSYTACEEWYK